MPRASVTVDARDASGGIKAAREADGFERAPSAKPGKRDRGDYGAGDLFAAKTGPLSKRMQEVFARDTRLDPGVEQRVEKSGRGSVADLEAYRRESRRVESSKEVEALARKLKGRVVVTKTGAVQIRRTKDTPDGKRPGTVAKTVRPPFSVNGKFSSPIVKREIRVTDEEAFRRSAESRVDAYGTSLFGRGNVTPARRQAMLSGLQRDRERRGWEGVPDL